MKYKGLVPINDTRFNRTSLTCEGESYTGTKREQCYIQEEGVLYAPRYWAQCNGYGVKSVFPKVVWPKFQGTYRAGQKEAIDETVKGLKQSNSGLLEAFTGAGKTLLGLSIAARLGTKALIVCNKTDLLDQWCESGHDFFGLTCGHLQGDVKRMGNHFTVATVQTLYSRIDDIKYWNKFGLVIFDESHHVPAKSFTSIISRMPARYRLGVSATFVRTDGMEDVWKWHLGEKLHVMEGKALAGYYHQPTLSFPLNDRSYTKYGKIQHSALLTAIADIDNYNMDIAADAKELVKSGRKIIVVSERVSQLESIAKYLKSGYGFYCGKANGKVISKDQLEKTKTKKIILATRGKIGEGSDLPSFDTLWLASPMTSVIQVVGRITRQHKGKKIPLVIDPVFNTPYNKALASKRKKGYADLDLKSISEADLWSV